MSNRIEVSTDKFHSNPESVMEKALEGEVAVVDKEGEARFLIVRKVEPLEP